nr:hypothetical protein [uncultured Roseibium sp.]
MGRVATAMRQTGFNGDEQPLKTALSVLGLDRKRPCFQTALPAGFAPLFHDVLVHAQKKEAGFVPPEHCTIISITD